ncbi:MAG: hypothetical protein HOM84_05235 [Thiotrichales bacterium]|jgi:hypothetical protein|nr:hypothetical protein [Thiotrichales bacterium]MBT3613034.1 hypothetical protein [Thiotrichales bacterium]MBT3751936.1 hypothetical protein [Thiotrichales bacterium]MBT3837640.1 hypothetical protein [Thiotrichales bacterium]MBT4152322.1 hypothetical protein [Thiotrichales bacterium]
MSREVKYLLIAMLGTIIFIAALFLLRSVMGLNDMHSVQEDNKNKLTGQAFLEEQAAKAAGKEKRSLMGEINSGANLSIQDKLKRIRESNK